LKRARFHSHVFDGSNQYSKRVLRAACC